MPRPAEARGDRITRCIAANRQASSGTGFAIPSLPFWGCRCPKVCGNPMDGATCPVRRKFALPAVLQQTVKPLAGRDLQSRPHRFAGCRCPKVCGNPADGATCPVRRKETGRKLYGRGNTPRPAEARGDRITHCIAANRQASRGTGFAIPSPPFGWLPIA